MGEHDPTAPAATAASPARRPVRCTPEKRSSRLDVAGLAQEEIGIASELDEPVAGVGIARVGDDALAVGDAEPEGLHRVDDLAHLDAQRTDLEDVAVGQRVEGEGGAQATPSGMSSARSITARIREGSAAGPWMGGSFGRSVRSW